MNRLDAMAVFVRVLETGSFSEAARQLRMGQPAVSKAVAQLEKRLAVRLLVRTTRGLAPTDAGQGFYERARRVVLEADEAEIAARGAGAALAGRLRVSVGITFGRIHVIPHMAGLLAAHPGLDVDLVMDDRTTDLVEEGIDVALRLGTPAGASLTGRRIAECRRLVVATPAWLERTGEPAAPGDLARHQAISPAFLASANVWTFARGGESVPVTLAGRLRVTAGEGVRAAVLAGLGFAVASEWLFAPELADGRVRPMLTGWSLPPVELWALFPTGRLPTARARAFVAFVEERLAESAGATPA